MITKILTKSIVSSFVSRIITATAHNAQVILEWMLNLDGTNYMELSEPKTFAGDFEIEIEFSTAYTGGNTCLIASSTDNDRLYIDTSGTRFAFKVGDSIVFWTPSVNISDGENHIIKIAANVNSNIIDWNLDNGTDTLQTTGFVYSTPIYSTIAARGDNLGIKFQGVIHSVNLTDLDTPSNSISWNIDSGPETGTIYQDSEEYGTDSDIMRADDWGTPPAGVTVDGRTATFDGTQVDWANVKANNDEYKTGEYAINYRIFNLTQGGIKVEAGTTTTYHTSNGVFTTFEVSNNRPFKVQANDNSTIGSVEIISIKPVPQGLIMQNVSTEDWAKQ